MCQSPNQCASESCAFGLCRVRTPRDGRDSEVEWIVIRFYPASAAASSEIRNLNYYYFYEVTNAYVRNLIASHKGNFLFWGGGGSTHICSCRCIDCAQVARDCGMLPLALGMAGTLAKDQPMDPASWQTVHEKLQEKHTKYQEMENGKLFSVIDTSLFDLPFTQQEQLRLMAVMASGVVATSEMLANLWKQVCVDRRRLVVARFASQSPVMLHRCCSHRRWIEGRRASDSSPHVVL